LPVCADLNGRARSKVRRQLKNSCEVAAALCRPAALTLGTAHGGAIFPGSAGMGSAPISRFTFHSLGFY
jgi:hypothetical protein